MVVSLIFFPRKIKKECTVSVFYPPNQFCVTYLLNFRTHKCDKLVKIDITKIFCSQFLFSFPFSEIAELV